MTLRAILDYANTLTDGSFTDLSEIIHFLNEAQDLICRFDRIQAGPATYVLTTNSITLPTDCMQAAKMTYNDIPLVLEEEPWAGVITLPTAMTEGTIKLWYYRYPATLLSTTPTQVPDVGTQYHRAMASYAAKQYFLIDDDAALRDAFKTEFVQSLQALKMAPGFTGAFANY